MPLIDPKQIDAFFSARVRVPFTGTGGTGQVVTAFLTTALNTAGRGGGTVPLRPAANGRSGIDSGDLNNRIQLFASDDTPITEEGATYGGATVTDRFVYGSLTVAEGIWSVAYYVRTNAGNKPYTLAPGAYVFWPSYSFHMGQLPATAFASMPPVATGPRGLDGDDGWAVPVQRISAQGDLVIDYAAGKHVELTLTGNITSITVENWPVDEFLARLTIDTFNDGGYDITWPAAWRWSYGSVPILSKGVGATDTFVIRTTTAGASIRADVGGMNYS